MSYPITLDCSGDAVITSSLHLPLPHGRNRAGSRIEARTLDFVRRHRLLSPGSPTEAALPEARLQELTALVYRREDEEALQIAADFLATLFFFDELVDHSQAELGVDSALARRAAGLLVESVRTGEAPSPGAARGWPIGPADQRDLLAVGAALADVSRRLSRRDPPAIDPFFHACEGYLRSHACETVLRRGQRHASLGEHAAARTGLGAGYAAIELGLALRGVVPSAQERRDPDFRRAMEAASLSVSYLHDLFSYGKERASGVPSNLVTVIERLSGAPPAVAFAEGCRVTDAAVAQFLRSRATLEAVHPGARAATELFESWIRGHYDWHASLPARPAPALSTPAPVDCWG